MKTARHHFGRGNVLVALSTVIGVSELVIQYPITLLDVLRVITVTEGGVVSLIAALIAYRYRQIYRATPSSARLLPRHVARLGLGTALTTFASSALILAGYGQPFVWYVTPILMPAFTVFVIGLLDMVGWLPTRAADNATTVPDPKPQRRSGDGTSLRAGVSALFVILCLLVALLFASVQSVVQRTCEYQKSNSQAILTLGTVFTLAAPKAAHPPAIRRAIADYQKRLNSISGPTSAALHDLGTILQGGADPVKVRAAENEFVKAAIVIRGQHPCDPSIT